MALSRIDVVKYHVEKEFGKLKKKDEASVRKLVDGYKQFQDEKLDPAEIDELNEHVLYLLTYFHQDADLKSGKEKIREISILKDPKHHEDWLSEWAKKNPERYYWNLQKNHLKDQFEQRKIPGKEARSIIESLDHSTENILRELENPKRIQFNNKGLVLGYVQSGKTANFSALIAKAADAGYKFIIVLGGIHNVLRSQTQLRLDQEVTGHYDKEENKHSFIKITRPEKRWVRITNYVDQEEDPRAKGDFTVRGISSFDHYFEHTTQPVLAVVKKNCSVLRSLIGWVNKGSEDILKKAPLLIIDDEADQASIDTNANKKFNGPKDADPAETNKLIRQLLSKFQRKAYIGYSATPFANVLIGKDAHHIEFNEDLYPRNFIATLPKPDKYFGPERLFGSDLRDQFIKLIDDERKQIMKDVDAPAGLEEAVFVFILSCAIRLYRKDSSKPMSMLIHVDQKTSTQEIVYDVVDALFKAMKSGLETKKGSKRYVDGFRKIYENGYLYKKADRKALISDCRIINKSLGKAKCENPLPDFDTLEPLIKQLVQEIELLKLNSKSEDRLDYRNNPGLKVIAVGGNVLSRGLTLEGLMTSYYLRSTTQADTLLQMGRWFGYRNNYEDLVRIFTTKLITQSYEKMALLEEMVRGQISQYVYEELTPADFPVALKVFEKIKVTSKSKMGAGIKKQAFSDTVIETTWMPLDDKKALLHNLEVGKELINKLCKGKATRTENGRSLFRNVSTETVEHFLAEYKYFDSAKLKGGGLDHKAMLEYIQRRRKAGEINKWSVLVAGASKVRNKSNKPIKWGMLDGVQMIERSRLSKYEKQDGLFNLGVISSPTDLRADLGKGAKHSHDGRKSNEPLLVIYRIWAGSKALEGSEYRIDLFKEFPKTAEEDVVGFSVVFPESADKSEKEEHIVQIFTK